jgi:hypothetical protein
VIVFDSDVGLVEKAVLEVFASPEFGMEFY